MSRETNQWLQNNVLRGFTDKRGRAWWATRTAEDSTGESNHYPGAIPVADLRRRLFGWTAVPVRVSRDPLPGQPGGPVALPDFRAWVRDDNGETLEIHSDTYKGHQYGTALVSNVEQILDQGLDVANAGLLRRGAVGWVQVEMPDNIDTPEGVTFRPFLMATTSFDGSIATTYKLGYTDVVCDNTREMFLSEAGNTYRVRHTANSGMRIADARTALEIMFKQTEGIEAEIRALCSVDVSDKQWSAFLEAHQPISADTTTRSTTMAENRRAELTKLWNTDTRVSPWRGTAWGVVQATNTYMHHIQTVKNVTRAERNMLRAVKGEIGGEDRKVLTVLGKVLDRELVGAGTK
jgi:phage/plasmid-like protein (TIGR03299 family)